MEEVIALAKALADENRLRILFALDHQELCVCQITDYLALAPSTVSKHLSILKQARLVSVRKDGRWAYYRLAGSDSTAVVKSALAWVRQSFKPGTKTPYDSMRLERVLQSDLKGLCQD